MLEYHSDMLANSVDIGIFVHQMSAIDNDIAASRFL